MPHVSSITAAPSLVQRQLWGRPTTTTALLTPCLPITLASGGVLTLDPTTTITFTANHLFQPNCVATDGFYYTDNSTVEGNKEPFYASTTVLIYVVATSTVISWLLLTLLFIAPGYHSPTAKPKSSTWFGGRGMSKIVSNSPSVTHFNSRPWLQKAAALLVTIALTIASANTFKAAEQQYNLGYMNAETMRNEVVAGYEIRILRVISDIFIWLAQIQTLIRLFPRRKEKLIIKWFGFLLILLDTTFSCLNSFYINSPRELPRSYSDAIPALSYLFQLSISLLYGAWVFYYVATKRRFAFFSKDMPNITIVSLLAIVSILIPVGFFVADVSVPVVAGWGDFFRWVGAAAASVVVWEWVERIEYLEREEKRNGILGREIFEEDEMYDGNSASKRTLSIGEKSSHGRGQFTSEAFDKFSGAFSRLKPRLQLRRHASVNSSHTQQALEDKERTTVTTKRMIPIGRMPASILLQRLQSDTPVSRTDTDTPSTIYAVHYHPIVTTPVVREAALGLDKIPESISIESSTKVAGNRDSQAYKSSTLTIEEPPIIAKQQNFRRRVQYATTIFKRGKRSPPLEVKRAMSLNGRVGPQFGREESRKGLKRRLARMVAGESVEVKAAPDDSQEPTVIPAPPRGHAWSPGIMQHSPVEVRNVRERQIVSPLDSTLAEGIAPTHSNSTPVSNFNHDTIHSPEEVRAAGTVSPSWRTNRYVSNTEEYEQFGRSINPTTVNAEDPRAIDQREGDGGYEE